MKAFGSNPKSEFRNPKQIQMIKFQNVFVLIIWILDIRACFGFRASNFEFIGPLVQILTINVFVALFIQLARC